MESAPPSYRLSDYTFEYPPEAVAAEPADRRENARLLILDRRSGQITHRRFANIGEYLHAGDCLVLNRSRVLPARLVGKKPTGGKAEILLVQEQEDGRWSGLCAALKLEGIVEFPEGITARAEERSSDGGWIFRFSVKDVRSFMRRYGTPPLPPYIRKRRREIDVGKVEDLERYQTVYAREEGSIAAPTAGLHFTPEVLTELKAKGVRIAEVILHVGLGTFLPINAEDVRDHAMLAEDYEIPDQAHIEIKSALKEKRRIVSVGTTATRTLETFIRTPHAHSGRTDMYIRPGHEFQAVGALVTNFHQPASTPLLLTCAFAGKEAVLCAYAEAVKKRYRLFSYGDSMLIL